MNNLGLEHFERIIREKKPNLRPASVRSYLSILRAFMAEQRDLKNPNDVLDFIKEPESIFSKKTRASHLLTWCKVLDAPKALTEIVNQILGELNEQTNELYMKQQGTEKQRKQGGAFVDYKKLIEMSKEIGGKINDVLNSPQEIKPVNFRHLRNNLLVRLQIDTRLRRDLNSIIAHFHQEMENKPLHVKADFARKNGLNFYDEGLGRMYIFNHKQSNKTLEPIITDIQDKALKDQLNKYIKRCLSQNATLLFPQSIHDKDRLNPMRKDTISSLIRKNIFQKLGVSGGTTAIRHSFLTHYYKPDENGGLQEMEDLATSMGHTPGMAMKYALKKKNDNVNVAFD